jgi:hypothetical protein
MSTFFSQIGRHHAGTPVKQFIVAIIQSEIKEERIQCFSSNTIHLWGKNWHQTPQALESVVVFQN